MRTMRDVWDERRKGLARRPGRPHVVRRFAVTSPVRRRHRPKGARAVRTWVFSKRPPDRVPERQLLVKRTKEPEVDLFDEEGELIVLADLPGVSERDIQVKVEKDLLIIEAVSTGPLGEVHYYKEVMLPYEVRTDYDRSSKSGVLEVHLRPTRRARRGVRTKDKRGSSISSGRPGKRKKRRRRKSESGETNTKRKRQTGPTKGPKRKS